MEQIIAVIAVAILAGCISLAVAFITKIDSKFSECIKKRKKLLDTHFILEINKTEKITNSIDPYLPFFQENETIRDWKEKRNSISDLILFTCVFTISGLLLGLLNLSFGTPIPLESLLIASGGFMFMLMIFRIITLHKKMQNWQETE